MFFQSKTIINHGPTFVFVKIVYIVCKQFLFLEYVDNKVAYTLIMTIYLFQLIKKLAHYSLSFIPLFFFKNDILYMSYC